MVFGIAWAALAFTFFYRWSSRTSWSEPHRLASVFGATLSSMAIPSMTIASWPKIDILGKLIFDAFSLAGFLLLATKVFRKQDHALPRFTTN